VSPLLFPADSSNTALDKVPLILIHGWCGDQSTWKDFIAGTPNLHDRFRLYYFVYPTGSRIPDLDLACGEDEPDHSVVRVQDLVL
jgi:pimeloyl-ACP methyl ester carboxylesterase